MKALSYLLTLSAVLSLLTGCGKDNKSGQNGMYDFNNPYSVNPLMGGLPIGAVNSPYSYGGVSVNQVIAENPCISGYGGMGNPGSPYAGQRIPIQIPLTNFPSVVQANDVYVGVTSYGDVAALVGTAPGQPPMFVGYMCPRSFAQNGMGQLTGIKIGAYTKCAVKPMVAATIVFPGTMATADFRMLEGGTSTRQKFSFCSL